MLYTKEEIDYAIEKMKMSCNEATEEFVEKSSYEKICSWLSVTWDNMYAYIDKNVRRTVKKFMKEGNFFSLILVKKAVMTLEEDFINKLAIKAPTLPETFRQKFFDFEFEKLMEDRYFMSEEESYAINIQLRYEQEMEKRICDSYVNHIKDSWTSRMKDFVVK